MFRVVALVTLVLVSHVPPQPTAGPDGPTPAPGVEPVVGRATDEAGRAAPVAAADVDPAVSGPTHTRRVVTRDRRDPTLPRSVPRLELHPDGAAHRERLERATQRFAAAGLRLPDLVVELAGQGDDCLGHYGLFDRSSTPWRVAVCSDLEFVLTHELAHAWAAANLDDEARAVYLEHRGLESWSDPRLDWRERGTEDAAFVIQQVLMAEHVRPGWDVWEERLAAYELLTRQPGLVHGPLDADRGARDRSDLATWPGE